MARGATQFVDSVNLIAKATDGLGNATYDIQTRVSNALASRLKILGTGDIKDKVSIEADLISKAAVVKLEKAGGTIQLKK